MARDRGQKARRSLTRAFGSVRDDRKGQEPSARGEPRVHDNPSVLPSAIHLPLNRAPTKIFKFLWDRRRGGERRGRLPLGGEAPPKAVMRGTAKEQSLCLTPHPSLRDTFPRGGRHENRLRGTSNDCVTVRSSQTVDVYCIPKKGYPLSFDAKNAGNFSGGYCNPSGNAL